MKRIMSLLIPSLVVILIGSGAFTTSLLAQSDFAMTVNVPFPFTVGTQSIAPGTYRFSLESSPFQLAIVDVKNGHEKLFSVHPGKQCAVGLHGRLLFRKSGDRSYLYEIRFPRNDTFTDVIL